MLESQERVLLIGPVISYFSVLVIEYLGKNATLKGREFMSLYSFRGVAVHHSGENRTGGAQGCPDIQEAERAHSICTLEAGREEPGPGYKTSKPAPRD